MADKGILFSAPMVRALLDGRKTQTRRLLRHPEYFGCPTGDCPHDRQEECNTAMASLSAKEVGYAPGDRLYVRESYYQFGHWERVIDRLTKGGRQKWAFIGVPGMVMFDAPADFLSSRSLPFPGAPRWYKRLGRFMPRTASRIWLAVSEVRVQRLQDCSEADAIAEGIQRDSIPDGLIPGGNTSFGYPGYSGFDTAISAYTALWNSLHTAEGERWQDNPWVCAISFTVHRGNIDGEGARHG